MAINKKLIHFDKKSIFVSANGINDTNSIQNKQNIIGQIPYHSIVTIKDSNELWTHGMYIGGNIKDNVITLGGKTYISKINDTTTVGPLTGSTQIKFSLSWEEIPINVYDNILKENGTYIIQINWDNVIYTGIFPYKEVHQNTSYDSIEDCPIINTNEEIVLTCCGYMEETKARLYLKLAKGSRGTEEVIAGSKIKMPTKPTLYIATSKADLKLGDLTFKFRQLI